jgi:hypothetical protein
VLGNIGTWFSDVDSGWQMSALSPSDEWEQWDGSIDG